MAEKVVITGVRSTIITELFQLVHDLEVHRPELMIDILDLSSTMIIREVPVDVTRYIFAAGVSTRLKIYEQTGLDIETSLAVNLVSVMKMCEHVLEYNPNARICVIGSTSGECGSSDQVYAVAKAGLHRYVETRMLRYSDQQLVCVAPGIIEDSGMTRRRTDTENLRRRRDEHPKGRFLRAIEVAKMIRFLLWEDEGYTTNVVVRMEGTIRCGG